MSDIVTQLQRTLDRVKTNAGPSLQILQLPLSVEDYEYIKETTDIVDKRYWVKDGKLIYLHGRDQIHLYPSVLHVIIPKGD